MHTYICTFFAHMHVYMYIYVYIYIYSFYLLAHECRELKIALKALGFDVRKREVKILCVCVSMCMCACVRACL